MELTPNPHYSGGHTHTACPVDSMQCQAFIWIHWLVTSFKKWLSV